MAQSSQPSYSSKVILVHRENEYDTKADFRMEAKH